MTEKVIDKVVSFVDKELIITGGEPSLVKPRVEYILKQVNLSTVKVTIETNLFGWTFKDLDDFINRGIYLDVSVLTTVGHYYQRLVENGQSIIEVKKKLRYIADSSLVRAVIVLSEDSSFGLYSTFDYLYSIGIRRFKIVPRVPNHFSDLNIEDCRKRFSWLYEKVF